MDIWAILNQYIWVPGVTSGSLGVIAGSLAGIFAPYGRHKRLVLSLMYSAVALSAIWLIIGVAAYLSGQPRRLWYSYFVPGVVVGSSIGGILGVVTRRYRERG
jgi:hypothetical protein